MPVFDFNNTPDTKEPVKCTYTTFASDADHASAEQPILILDNSKKEWKHHSCGVFANQNKQTAFEFDEEGGKVSADILRVDSRFVSLLKWLGENRINVRMSGVNNSEGYCVYRIREIAFGGGTKLSAEDGFLQFMIERLFASDAPEEEIDDEDQEESGDDMKLTSKFRRHHALTACSDTPHSAAISVIIPAMHRHHALSFILSKQIAVCSRSG